MKIMAVIPAYNEEGNIENTIKEVKEYISDIIIIDDGSTDRTYQIAKKNARVIRLKQNKGKGNAIKIGFKIGLKEKKAVVIIDADSEISPENIPNLIAGLRMNDIVIGVRKNMRSKKRKIMNYIAARSVQFITGYKLEDVMCGFRAFNNNYLKKIKLKADGFETEIEQILEAYKNNLKIVKVNVQGAYKKSKHQNNITILKQNYYFQDWVVKNIMHLKHQPLLKRIIALIICIQLRLVTRILSSIIKT